MNSYYPIMLRLEGKKAAVIGGGKVAERKVLGLLEAGARVTVISPLVTKGLKKLANSGKIDWQETKFSPADVKDALLIFAATDDLRVNQFVKESAEPHQLVTIANDPDASDFHLPSQMKRGRLMISVSTGGASPVLARKIRANLEQQYDRTYEEYLEFLFAKRQWILNEVADSSLKKKLLTALAGEAFLISSNREADFEQLYNGLKEADSC